MISSLFHVSIYVPLYNGLVYLIDVIPTHDVGVAVILLTVAVRVILFPISRAAVRTQKAMKEIGPEVEALKVKYKDKQDEQARAIFALYREKNIRPFSSFFLVFLQLPILIGLYWVFARGGLPTVHAEILYPFVKIPAAVNMKFFGLTDMGSRSIVLAGLAGVTQLIYARLSMGARKVALESEASFSADMAKSFDLQARYVLPVMIAGIAYTVAAAVPLYWVASNTFMIVQEYFAGSRLHDKASPPEEATP